MDNSLFPVFLLFVYFFFASSSTTFIAMPLLYYFIEIDKIKVNELRNGREKTCDKKYNY